MNKPVSGLKLIVGLGNPGADYSATRHNAGFWFVDRLAAEHEARFAVAKKFFGELAQARSPGLDCWLFKPATYMNNSGHAVRAVTDYYRIETARVLVVHDEIDLDAGTIRLKRGGGHGGHKGLRDVIEKLGDSDCLRLRIGVSHPGARTRVLAHVLSRPRPRRYHVDRQRNTKGPGSPAPAVRRRARQGHDPSAYAPGRLMGFKCGIVGLPNVGKSTLFNALTRAGVSAGNYPFCTIEPNTGMVPVPDSRLQAIARIVKPERVIPAQVEFVDVAGLVAGASKGAGLGNRFLGQVRETHAIAQVLRCFEDDNVTHVSGRIDPLADLDVVNTELCLADLETLQRALQKTEKVAQAGNKRARERARALAVLSAYVDGGAPARALPAGSAQRQLARELGLLTEKPVLYVANVEETGITSNKWLAQLARRAAADSAGLLAISAAIEAEISDEISEPGETGKTEFLRDLGLSEPGLHRLIRAGYELLGTHTFFTTESGKVQAWTITKGSVAPRAAGVIHKDFEKGFIRAEVIACDDFIEHQGEQGAKNAGKWRLQGKDYVVRDGDVILFRFNV